MKFAQFMSSAVGRILRVVAGVALVWWGWTMQSTTGYIVIVVGLVPLLAGLFNVCVFAPLFGGPFRGKDVGVSAPTQSMPDNGTQ